MQRYSQSQPAHAGDFVPSCIYIVLESSGACQGSHVAGIQHTIRHEKKTNTKTSKQPFWTFPHLTLDQFSSNYTVVKENAEQTSGPSLPCLWPLSHLLLYAQTRSRRSWFPGREQGVGEEGQESCLGSCSWTLLASQGMSQWPCVFSCSRTQALSHFFLK